MFEALWPVLLVGAAFFGIRELVRVARQWWAEESARVAAQIADALDGDGRWPL